MNKKKLNEYSSFITKALTDFVASIPESKLSKARDPIVESEILIAKASWKSATVSGGLALVPGPYGMATVVPDMIAVWKVQGQLIADIAAVYGKTEHLNQETLLYCLFKNTESALFKDIFVRVGEKFLVKRMTLQYMEELLVELGFRVTQKVVGKALGRWILFIGAAAVAWYTKRETRQAGEAAKEFFSVEIEEIEIGELK